MKAVQLSPILIFSLVFLGVMPFALPASAAEGVASWRMMGDYPLIAGRWAEAEKKGIFVTVEQDGNKFVANCTYKNDKGVEVHWRADGTISKNGEVTAHLVVLTRPKDWPTATRTGRLDQDGKTLHLHAKWDNGVENDLTWKLKEPYAHPSSPLAKQSATTSSPEAKVAGGDSKTNNSPNHLTVDLGGSIKLEMVLIPAGEFLMGSPDSDKAADFPDCDNEKPQHRVRITKPFYLGKYQVTQEQWQAVMGKNPSCFKGPTNPVERVTWYDCQEFLKRLNKQVKAGTFVLPTEAQWEYACRAGSTTRYCFGNKASKLGEYAWYSRNSGRTTHPVGEKKPNAWGLYDMHGNVCELCSDRYWHKYYTESPTDDPTGSNSGDVHTVRGGDYDRPESWCRAAHRFLVRPEYGPEWVGFRVCAQAPMNNAIVVSSEAVSTNSISAGNHRNTGTVTPREHGRKNDTYGGAPGDNVTIVLSKNTSVTLPRMKFYAHGHEYVTEQVFSATSIPGLVEGPVDRLISNDAFTIRVERTNGGARLGLPKRTRLVPEHPPWSFVAAYYDPKDLTVQPIHVHRLRDSDDRREKDLPPSLFVRTMIGQLKDADWTVRQNACTELEAAGTKGRGAIPALIEALRDQQRKVRFAALSALGAMGPASKQAVPEIITLLQHTVDAYDCAQIIEVLGEIGPDAKDAVPVILKVAKRKNHSEVGLPLRDVGPARDCPIPYEMEHYAAVAFGQIGPDAEPAIPYLIERLRVGEAHWANPPPSAQFDAKHVTKKWRMIIAHGLAGIGKASVPALVELLADSDAGVADAAQSALSEIGEAAIPAVVAATKSNNSVTCERAVLTLAILSDQNPAATASHFGLGHSAT